ncbi:uncharacterized protein FTJAE_9830 [Fusarium tjaetaba]|uniref:Methyltransferase type 12 domain-containing protein n=1 Tax=Fusarium tjaetaba TaxID=1567544 RepID=A0A8H5VID3_9HYPO|nr:uncharacterized protein FTJAE_9830 [Fusarium tjaetaba]KAF5625847.1 hypothetical protein FTJAE_9830 [Fusarium tjaetaba]
MVQLTMSRDWIGIKPPSSRPTKLLDYACGDGVASRALAPFMSTVRGMDIASGMVEQYNKLALKAGYTSTKMRAVQADLIDPELTPSPEIDTPGFFDFDVVVMCMALHHIEEPDNMILQLSKRLRPGGILLIIDWVNTYPLQKSRVLLHLAPGHMLWSLPHKSNHHINTTAQITRLNMKPKVLLTAGLAAVAIADQWPMAKEKCGRLGPMEWDPNDLPPDFNVMNIRMCADHPMGAGNYWGWGEYLPDWFPRNPFADMEINWLWWP